MSLNNNFIIFIIPSYFRHNNTQCYLKIEPLKSINKLISRIYKVYSTYNLALIYTTAVIKYEFDKMSKNN